MNKLAIVDIDGVVADSTTRFAKAEEARTAFLNNNEKCLDAILSGSSGSKEATNLYWQTALNPELVELDTLIEGVRAAITAIEYDYDYQVVYLTSRPESMREATADWLASVNISGPKLIMKAPAFQYTKTTVWKAGMVQTLASLYGASELLVIDDEAANLEALRGTTSLEGLTMMRCYKSLDEAVKALAE